jgi:hypothetical protein
METEHLSLSYLSGGTWDGSYTEGSARHVIEWSRQRYIPEGVPKGLSRKGLAKVFIALEQVPDIFLCHV